MKVAVDCREMNQGDVREEIVLGNAFGGKLGSHGSKVILLSHVGGGAITTASLSPQGSWTIERLAEQ